MHALITWVRLVQSGILLRHHDWYMYTRMGSAHYNFLKLHTKLTTFTDISTE